MAIVLTLATVSTGLIAGLFYTFACAVMPALRRVEDDVFIRVMTTINASIQNFWFAVAFLGSLLLPAAALVLEILAPRGILVPAALAVTLYVVVLVVTFRINIPLNQALDRGSANPGPTRKAFETRWNRWNLVRAAASTASFALLCVALAGIRQ